MKCLIADDEYPARQLLEAYLARIPGMEVAGTCANAMQVLAALQAQPVDLLLLDIQMPDLTGLELLRTLATRPQVILVTAYADHAVTGFELEVTDYLVKPVSFERFVQAVNRAQARMPAAAPLPTPPVPPPTADHFFVKVDYKLVKIRFEDILFVEGMREYVNIQTAARRHIVYQSMKNMEELLPADRFARTHKSFIVALDKIDSLYGNIVEVRGREVPIGKSYKETFMQRIQTL
ncbi:MAG: LytTR family DNA-binding domain-containing protein [Bacteroidia bacterium]|nr:LytTR family DNA-binding domain-containing protein [Bacteroidia bacterium]